MKRPALGQALPEAIKDMLRGYIAMSNCATVARNVPFSPITLNNCLHGRVTHGTAKLVAAYLERMQADEAVKVAIEELMHDGLSFDSAFAKVLGQ